jgi:hypothetical protein
MDTRAPPRKKRKKVNDSPGWPPTFSSTFLYTISKCTRGRKRFTHAKPLFSRLSEDLTTYIFLFLPKWDHLCLAGTNKRLHTLGCTPTAWKKHVSLRGQTDTKLQALPEYVKPQSLKILGCKKFTQTWVCDLRNRGLINLDLSECHGVTDDVLAWIAELELLQCLDLRRCPNITGKGLEHLRKLPKLTHLILSGCHWLKDIDFKQIANLERLQKLVCQFCDVITGAGLAHLCDLSALRNVDLAMSNKVTAQALKRIKPLGQLQELCLCYCRDITREQLADLRHLPLKCCSSGSCPSDDSLMGRFME